MSDFHNHCGVRILETSRQRGSIQRAGKTDLVWLGDDLSARATWISGELAHGTLPADGRPAGVTAPADGATDRAPRPVRP